MSHCEQGGKGERAAEGENYTVKTEERNTLSRGKEMRHKGHSERSPHDKNRNKMTQ
jgi:hypothetical protein